MDSHGLTCSQDQSESTEVHVQCAAPYAPRRLAHGEAWAPTLLQQGRARADKPAWNKHAADFKKSFRAQAFAAGV